jgi:hypothetical protein
MNVRVSAEMKYQCESCVVEVVDEDRWIDQMAYLEDCGWEEIEEEDTTEPADTTQDEFDDLFELNRDN